MIDCVLFFATLNIFQLYSVFLFLLVEERAQLQCSREETTIPPLVNWQTFSHNVREVRARLAVTVGERPCDFDGDALTSAKNWNNYCIVCLELKLIFLVNIHHLQHFLTIKIKRKYFP